MLFSDSPTSNRRGVHATLGKAATTSCNHAVHFYEDDSLFLDSLSEFVGSALGAGGSCVVVATAAHRRGLSDRLTSAGIAVPYSTAMNRYIPMDAEETLHRFLVNGWPDEKRFFQVVEPAFLQARSGSKRKPMSIVAFGEMVSVLCEEGRLEAAMRLEQLWNELARRHAFSLRCAYPMHLFSEDKLSALFQRICEEHNQVIPSETYTQLASDSERWRLVSSLQQQASTLQAALELRQREMEQRVRVEDKLREAEEFARSILESSVDRVEVLDLEGRLEYINTPGCVALDLGDCVAILGRKWLGLWSEQDWPRAEAAINAAAKGAVGSFQGETAMKDGARKVWDVRIAPSRNANGSIERLIAVSRDITELRHAQVTAIRAEKLATAGRMAATIAHEINNPLEAVTNFIFLAQNSEGLPEQVREYLDVADRELTRVAHIARQTLGFYRSNSSSRWMPVSELVRDALMIYERRMRNKELEIEVSLDPELQVFGKDGELRQVVLNLTANAIDACSPHGKIWFRAQKARNWTNGLEPGVRFTLADNGTGMTPEVKQRLFAPFFTTKSDVGTGIGLWVTKSLVEQRGGYMHFRSRQGRQCGTVMSFFLPDGWHEESPTPSRV